MAQPLIVTQTRTTVIADTRDPESVIAALRLAGYVVHVTYGRDYIAAFVADGYDCAVTEAEGQMLREVMAGIARGMGC